jgi:putative glutamine amidotransferase
MNSYVSALRKAGWSGAVCLVGPGEECPPLATCAGLLLTGGGDIHPDRWDPAEPAHPRSEVDAERDALEIPAIREAWRIGLPILGICRGEQVLNVALGGSLHQHVPEAFGCPDDLHQRGSSKLPPDLRHAVSVDPASRLATWMGATEVLVNSRHHQAVDRVAAGLRAVAWHPGTRRGEEPIIEAVEATDPDRWVLGVQWHPENLVDLEGSAGASALSIFRAFLAALTP